MNILEILLHCRLISLFLPWQIHFCDFHHCHCVSQSPNWFSIPISHLLSKLACQSPANLPEHPTLWLTRKLVCPKQPWPSLFPTSQNQLLISFPWLLMTPHSPSPSIMKTWFHYFPHQTVSGVASCIAACFVIGTIYWHYVLFSMSPGVLVQACLTPSWANCCLCSCFSYFLLPLPLLLTPPSQSCFSK